MSHIAVTQAAVRNLATALSKVDTSSLKHGDRLALIAESFGWKVDAFMHALKQEAKSGVKNADANREQSRQLGSVDGETVPLERLGISHIAAWKEVLREPSGLIIVTGPTGAGKSITLRFTVSYLMSLGRRIHIPEFYKNYTFLDDLVEGDVVIVGEIRDSNDAEIAVKFAEKGMLVLASAMSNPSVVLRDLIDLGIAQNRLQSVKAVLHQYLVRKVRGDCSGLPESDQKYSGWTPISSLHIFDQTNAVEACMNQVNASKFGIISDLISKIAGNITNLSEVERCFGEEYRATVEQFIATARRC